MVKKVSIWLTLEPLLYSREIYLAEISRKLKKPHTTVRKQLAIFEKMGLVSKEHRGRQTLYKLKPNPLIIDYLTIIEKERLIKRSREEILLKEIVNFLHEFDNPILLFGSAVESLKKARDVDILIIGKFKKDKFEILEKKLNLKFHILNVRKFKEVSRTLKTEIKRKHLIIQGSSEAIKWLIS